MRILAGLDKPTTASCACTPAGASPCWRSSPIRSGRTLFDEARSALDELLAAH